MDSMNAARIVLITGAAILFIGILVPQVVRRKSRKVIMLTAVVTALILPPRIVGLGFLDRSLSPCSYSADDDG